MKIIIENIKNIKRLEFDIPKNNVVYALTGINGSGKTTLLAALYRIRNGNSFPKYFRSSSDDKLDSFSGRIHYEIDGERVYYQYAQQKWTPHPRRKASLLHKFPFANVCLIPPNESRLFIHEKELNIHRIRSAEPELKNYMNEIFSTNKFDSLKIINTDKSRGKKNRQKVAYLLSKTVNGKTLYFSEKNFSLGEIIILNLFLELKDIPKKSLILIDEIELALHPKIQINLVDYLKKYAKENNTKILLSTHSTSIVRHLNNIIFLKNSINHTEVIYNAYPAQAIGEIAYQDDLKPDIIFLVEDRMGLFLLQAMLKLYAEISQKTLPDYKIVPIGGFKNVLEFHSSNKHYLFNNIPIFSFLDLDVIEDIIPFLSTKKDSNKFFKLYTELKDFVDFLPITPELGIIEFIKENHTKINENLRNEFCNNSIDVNRSLVDFNNLAQLRNDNSIKDILEKNGKVRKAAKEIYSKITEDLINLTNQSDEIIHRHLNKIFIDEFYAEYHDCLKRLFGVKLSKIKYR